MKSGEVKKVIGKMSGGRSSNNSTDDLDMTIRVEDASSGLMVLEIRCTPDALMRTISNEYGRPCEVEVWLNAADQWGKTHEAKRELLDATKLTPSNFPDHLRPQIEALEVDGWEAEYLGSDGTTRSSGYNSHRISFERGEKRYSVAFHRYV